MLDRGDKAKDEFLKDLYYKQRFMTGRDKLFYHISKTLGNKFITKRYIESWLKKQTVQQLYTERKKKTTIRPVLSKSPGNFLQFDLIDFSSKDKRSKEGYRYILNVICSFSRKLWLRPLRSKTTKDVLVELNKILDEIQDDGKVIRVVQSDNAVEFRAIKFNNGIKHIFSQSYTPQSQSIVERSHRFLKSVLNKVTYSENTKWDANIIKSIQDVYNNTVNKTTGKTPNESWNLGEAEQADLHETLKSKSAKSYKEVDTLLKVGATVRIVEPRLKIKNKGEPLWSTELYKIKKVILGNRDKNTINRYQLVDSDGTIVRGYYPLSKLLYVPQA